MVVFYAFILYSVLNMSSIITDLNKELIQIKYVEQAWKKLHLIVICVPCLTNQIFISNQFYSPVCNTHCKEKNANIFPFCNTYICKKWKSIKMKNKV